VRQYGRIEVVAAKIALDPHVTHRNALAGLGGIQQKFCNRGFNMTQPKKGNLCDFGQAYVNVVIQAEKHGLIEPAKVGDTW
jgi:hypothetical protein